MTSIASILGFFVYISISLLGIMCVPNPEKDTGNILEILGLDAKTNWIMIPDIFYLIVMAFHIPVIFFILKDGVLIMIDECMRKSTSQRFYNEQDSLLQTTD